MAVAHRTFALTSPLMPAEVLRRTAALLTSEGVRYKSTPLSIASTSTPFAVLGIQPRLYSRRNWIGLNPFAHASSVNLICERAGHTTNIVLHVDRTRAVFFALFWAACGGLSALPLPLAGVVAVMIVVASLAWFHIAVLGGRLIAREIEVALATPLGAA